MTRIEFRKVSPMGYIVVGCDHGIRIARDADWTPKMRATEDARPQVLHRQFSTSAKCKMLLCYFYALPKPLIPLLSSLLTI